MKSISEKIIELRIATRKVTLCEAEGRAKTTLSLKSKILFLLKDKDLSPSDIISALGIAKTNLTILTSSMIKDGLIIKYKKPNDQRAVFYSITQKGKEHIGKLISYIDALFDKVIDDEETKNKYINEITDIIDLISFL